MSEEITPPCEQEWNESDRQWFERIRALEAEITRLRDALTNCPGIASMWSMRPTRRLHPDLAWEEMNETAQTCAHSAAQQIAIELEVHVDAALKEKP